MEQKLLQLGSKIFPYSVHLTVCNLDYIWIITNKSSTKQEHIVQTPEG